MVPAGGGGSGSGGKTGLGGGGQNTTVVPSDDGGCSCRAAETQDCGSLWLLALALLGVRRVRRRVVLHRHLPAGELHDPRLAGVSSKPSREPRARRSPEPVRAPFAPRAGGDRSCFATMRRGKRSRVELFQDFPGGLCSCSVRSGSAASTTSRSRSASAASSNVARNAANRSLGMSRMKPTVSVSTTSPPVGQVQLARAGVERREQLVLGEHAGIGERVQERALAGVGVADDGHDRHARARAALPARCALLGQVLELSFELRARARARAGVRSPAWFRQGLARRCRRSGG